MYVAQFGPRDVILGSYVTTTGVRTTLTTNLQTITMERNTGNVFLSLILPEVVLATLIFKFFIVGSGGFKISTDNYSNYSEDYSSDYLKPGIYINEESTNVIQATDPNTISVITHEYTGHTHKSPQDRCVFRISNSPNQPCNIAGILVKAK